MEFRRVSNLEGEHARKLLRQYLCGCQAANVEMLVRRLGMRREIVAAELRRLTEQGEVETLEPVRPSSTGDADSRVYYRLRRPNDGDLLWEQDMPAAAAARAPAADGEEAALGIGAGVAPVAAWTV